MHTTYQEQQIVLGTLRRVLNLYEKHRWGRGAMVVLNDDDTYTFCLSGAIREVASVSGAQHLYNSRILYTTREIQKTITRPGAPYNRYIVSWNDQDARDKRHVISVIKQTMKRVQKECKDDIKRCKIV